MGIANIKKFQETINLEPYRNLSLTYLPNANEINCSVSQAIAQRRSCRQEMLDRCLNIQDLSDLLYYGYGKKSNGSRNVPSAGALYPLDVYVYCANINSIDVGLYYYSVKNHGLRCISTGDKKIEIEKIFADSTIFDLVKNASVFIFVTASFLRNIWKYFERGYRFSLIEVGLLAQNINLVASSKNLSCLNIGGFYDYESNKFLKLDGLLDASLYMICIGYVEKNDSNSR